MKQIKNIFLEIEYVGTNYHGFQIQNKRTKKEITVQEVLEESLFRLFRRNIRVAYSSRTDKGVHARAQAVNFKVNTAIPLKNIKAALHTFLPSDVRIRKIKKMPLDFHARFSASSKIYRYVIYQGKDFSVFQNNFSWHIDMPLDREKMKKAAKKICGYRDFSLFAKAAKNYKDCRRRMKDITIKKRGSFIYIDLEADGFLRAMARNIVSFLVAVGKGNISLKEVGLIVSGKCSYTNKPAPACGLYLWKVFY